MKTYVEVQGKINEKRMEEFNKQQELLQIQQIENNDQKQEETPA